MACVCPIYAYPAAPPARGVVFSASKSYQGARAFPLRCGKCIGCRISRSREWALRCVHEASLHDDNCFLTLTYNDANFPLDGGVHVRPVQLFLKRLRKATGRGLRFFACGEYGEKTLRPHHHMLAFGYRPEDLEAISQNHQGDILYRSDALERAWQLGNVIVGDVNYQSAAYVARYSLKKIGGDEAEEHYLRAHPHTGELHQVPPEFVHMSNRPGIGRGWFDQFGSDAFPSDYLVFEGHKVGVPSYYFRQLPRSEDRWEDRKTMAGKIIDERRSKTLEPEYQANTTEERLRTREEVLLLRVKRLERNTE